MSTSKHSLLIVALFTDVYCIFYVTYDHDVHNLKKNKTKTLHLFFSNVYTVFDLIILLNLILLK